MSDEQAAPIETPVTSSPPPETDENLSLSDHEAQYGEHRQDAQTESRTPPAETPVAEPDSTDTPAAEIEERDEKGRFKPKRHRAASQEAAPADVPRIRELTARLRSAEAERDALKARSSPSPSPSQPSPVASVVPVAPAPKPTPDQFTDYSEFNEALTDWKVDQKLAAAEQKRHDAEQQRVQQQERVRIVASWEARKAAARLKYPDFDAVALGPTLIPQGSVIDWWILENKTGADVLHHLQKHEDELQDLLAQPLSEQVEALALLSQRFNGSSLRPAAGSTGSAPTPVITPPPKPPNPVRTGALRAGDDPPADDASLLDHETYYQPRSRRRA